MEAIIINNNCIHKYNVYELSDMVIDVVSKMLEDLVEDIIRFRCSKCQNICKVLIKDKCIKCIDKIE